MVFPVEWKVEVVFLSISADIYSDQGSVDQQPSDSMPCSAHLYLEQQVVAENAE